MNETPRGQRAAAVGQLLLTLAEVYRQPLSELAIEAYLLALEDCAVDELEPAARSLLRTSRFLPTPAEWREGALELRRARQLARPALPEARPERTPEELAGVRADVERILAALAARMARPTQPEGAPPPNPGDAAGTGAPRAAEGSGKGSGSGRGPDRLAGP